MSSWDAKTDAQAREVWCPFTRADCLGSGCAAWRTIDPPKETKHTLTEAERPGGDGWENVGRRRIMPPSPTRWFVWERPWPTPRRGYCGMAGLSG